VLQCAYYLHARDFASAAIHNSELLEVCCSVLQRVAVCCHVLPCVAVCCSVHITCTHMISCVAGCCSVWQYMAVCVDT